MTEEGRKELKIYCFHRRLAASQVYGDDFIEKVKRAFSNNIYPVDENLIASPKHLAECEECKGYHDFFVGKKWEDCLNANAFGKLCGGQSFFKASAWHYYLPAYLIQLINNQRFFAGYEFQPREDTDLPELIEWQKEEISLLSSKQCEVIVDYLEITLKVWEGIEKGYQDDRKALNFWKENYQKALAKEQNLNK